MIVLFFVGCRLLFRSDLEPADGGIYLFNSSGSKLSSDGSLSDPEVSEHCSPMLSRLSSFMSSSITLPKFKGPAKSLGLGEGSSGSGPF